MKEKGSSAAKLILYLLVFIIPLSVMIYLNQRLMQEVQVAESMGQPTVSPPIENSQETKNVGIASKIGLLKEASDAGIEASESAKKQEEAGKQQEVKPKKVIHEFPIDEVALPQ